MQGGGTPVVEKQDYVFGEGANQYVQAIYSSAVSEGGSTAVVPSGEELITIADVCRILRADHRGLLSAERPSSFKTSHFPLPLPGLLYPASIRFRSSSGVARP